MDSEEEKLIVMEGTDTPQKIVLGQDYDMTFKITRNTNF